MNRIAVALLLICLAPGCIIVYAPNASRAALQFHEQTGSNLVNYAKVPIEPRLANELSGFTGIRGNVGSGNSVLSPTTKLK